MTRYEVVFGLLALLAAGLFTAGVLVLAGLGWALVVAGVLLAVPVVLLFSAPVPPIEGGALLEYIADNKAVYLFIGRP